MEILNFATDRQREYYTAWLELKSNRQVAKLFNVSETSVRKSIKDLKLKAALQGYSPEHNMTKPVPDGFKVKGVSSLYDQDGQLKAQWVKSTADQERQKQLLIESIQAMAEDLPKVVHRDYELECASSLLAVYPIGDAHIGMLSWHEETGEDWDLKIAEEIQCKAMDYLVKSSPASENAVIINLGDWYHFDNMDAVTTRSGHSLDTDGRYAKMARIGVKIMRQCIESALSRHKNVRVINVIGNHEDTSSIMLSICLANIYEYEPRVIIDTSPSVFNYVRHGKVLIGCHHGHTCKADKLPGVMATDRAKDWGETLYRYWYIGHIHHQSLKDYAGVTVESFRTLAAKDAYAQSGGYRAPRDMKAIIMHQDHGEVSRLSVNPSMLAC